MPAVYLAVFLSASALAISVFSFFFFLHYLKRRTGQERILSELREEVNKIMLSLDEKTDRDISLIEEREKNLKALLEETDKRLKVYTRELESRRKDEAVRAALEAKPPSPTYQELGKSRRRFNLPPDSAPDVMEAPPPAEVPPAAASPPGNEARPPVPAAQLSVGEQVRELARAGYSPQVIASRLELSIAEVELVTALMERRDLR